MSEDKQAYKRFLNKSVHILTKKKFHFNGPVIEVTSEHVMIEDKTVGLKAISYDEIEEMTEKVLND